MEYREMLDYIYSTNGGSHKELAKEIVGNIIDLTFGGESSTMDDIKELNIQLIDEVQNLNTGGFDSYEAIIIPISSTDGIKNALKTIKIL